MPNPKHDQVSACATTPESAVNVLVRLLRQTLSRPHLCRKSCCIPLLAHAPPHHSDGRRRGDLALAGSSHASDLIYSISTIPVVVLVCNDVVDFCTCSSAVSLHTHRLRATRCSAPGLSSSAARMQTSAHSCVIAHSHSAATACMCSLSAMAQVSDFDTWAIADRLHIHAKADYDILCAAKVFALLLQRPEASVATHCVLVLLPLKITLHAGAAR